MENLDKYCVVFLGAPGSGKTSIARFIAEKTGWKVVSAGNLLRQEVKKSTSRGKRIADVFNSGGLVESAIVNRIISDYIQHQQSLMSIFDAYPRKSEEIKSFFDILNEKVIALSAVIIFTLSDKVITQRLTGRLVCPVCGKIYNKFFYPPARVNVCSKCGAGLKKRADDKPQVVAKRIWEYEKETKPVEEFFKNNFRDITFTEDTDKPLALSVKSALSIINRQTGKKYNLVKGGLQND